MKLSLVFLFVIVDIVKKGNLLPAAYGFLTTHSRHRVRGLMSYPKNAESNGVERDEVVEKLNQAKEIVAQAISIGAPAYNVGDIARCAQVYEQASNQLAPFLPNDLQSKLLKEVSGIDGMDDDSRAWALRGLFDSISGYQLPFSPMIIGDDSNIVFQPFDATILPAEPRPVMDSVMGGISEGSWVPELKTFRGTTSLANNGGFSSLRWRFQTPQNWSHAKGIYFQSLQHSSPTEHTFRLILKDATCEQIRLSNFKAVFANPNESKEPLLIPFSAFDQMEQMGNPLVGSPGFRPSVVTEIGIMAIKPTVVGSFELHFEEWGLYN
ncbi:unnamed protein product [Cylindrotheca closterium]|uniref:NADH:ubiquinone oxidoreductase intermediate-associated protein 30 domain-containing protein n=1 Tax=Cylindrotheca closterium TaxID=2856 RepID=A0AAD2CI57_9STRA|nr:unnamed protein product [Cylindrotheca closterium]